MDNADVNGLCRIKGDYATLDDDVGVTKDGEFRININMWVCFLRNRFCSKDLDWRGENADVVLERVYNKLLKEISRYIKRLRVFCQSTEDNWYSLSFLYLEYQIKARVTEEYNRICNIFEDMPDQDFIDGVEWFDWLVHEIKHPGESVTDWRAREEREREALEKLFKPTTDKE